MKGLLTGVLALFCAIFSVSALELEFELNSSDKDALPSALSKAVNTAFDMNMKGMEALERKDYDGALAYFDEALSILPEYDDASNNRGVVYYRKGIISEAQKIWEELAASNPDYPVASYNLGLVFYHENQYDAAARLFERAIKANSKFAEALVRLGIINMQQGQKEKGLELLKKAYKIDPRNQDCWSFYAHGLILTADTAGAIAILKKRENNAAALKLMGEIESARKNFAKATDLLSRAVSAGADPSILVQLASIQIEQGKCKNALTTLKSYFSKKVDHSADSWLLAGIASKECGDVSGAQRFFEDGLKRFASDPILKYNLGQIYFHQKRYEQADETWEGLSDTVQDPSLLYLRALNARRRKDFKAARMLIERAVKMDSRAEYYDFLGVIFHLEKDDKKAEEQFRKALKIDPELRSAQLNLALLSRKDEDLGAVASQLQKQISVCNGDSCADLTFQLSIVYYHQKLIAKAAQVLAALKESDKDERIYRHMALFYRENSEWDKAILALETAAKRLVLEPQTEYELAETYLQAGQNSKAAECFLALIPKWRQNPWRLYYQLGYAYLEQNELDKATGFFQKSLKSKPDNVAAAGLLAFVYNRKGNVTEARKLWEKNLKDDPSNSALWINMGLSMERDGMYGEALEYYNKAAMLKGDDKELQLNIGNAYAGLDRHTDAINAYNQALSSGKRELAAYNIFLIARKKKDRDRADKMQRLLEQEYSNSSFTKRVKAEMGLWNGDTAKALSILEKIGDKDDSDWHSLAAIYSAKGNRDKTISALGKLPDEPQWKKARLLVMAQLAFKEGSYDQALRMFKEAGDSSFTAQYNIALASYNAARYKESLDIAERLSRFATGDDRADCCRLAGNSAFALKKWKMARQWYLQLSNVEVQNSIVQYNLAVASYNLKEIKHAWKYYQRARELDKTLFNKDIEIRYKQSNAGGNKDSISALDSTDIWYNMAVNMQSAGKDTAAELLYYKVLKKDSSYSLAWNNLGALYGVRGKIDQAENAYWKAIDKRHDIPETYANLINLYIELEEFVKARQWLIKGVGHNPESELLLGFQEKIADAEKTAKERIESEQ